MKPTEECNTNNYNIEEFDYEISPVELVQDIGVLIIEGRLPEFSQNGRREGNHCWPVCPNSKKECCSQSSTNKSSMCYFVESARRKIENEWKESSALFVEVLVCLDNLFPHSEKDKDPCELYIDLLPQNTLQRTLLLERWKLEVYKKGTSMMSPVSSSSFVSINLLLQAIRSFLHFSQLSAWLTRTGGRVPRQIIYRIIRGECSNHLDFQSNPEIHDFPHAMTSKTQNIRSTVFALPRCELETLISMSPYREYNLPIERQILLSSSILSKSCDPFNLRDKNSSKTTVENSFVADRKSPLSVKRAMTVDQSEKTPVAKNGAFGNRRNEEEGVDVIFVSEPMAYLRKKANGGKDAGVSGKLRKRLSFESSSTKTECFRIHDQTFERKDGRFEKFKGFSYCLGNDMTTNDTINTFLKPNKHTKSQTSLEESRKNIIDIVSYKVEECIKTKERDLMKNGSNCGSNSENVNCKFHIGDEFNEGDVPECFKIANDRETLGSHKHEKTDEHKSVDPVPESKGMESFVGIKKVSNENNESPLYERLKELDFASENKKLDKTNENSEGITNERKESLVVDACNSVVAKETKLDSECGQSVLLNTNEEKSRADRCQSSHCLTSLINKRSHIDKLRRCESYSGARPKQITSPYAACSVAVFNSSTGLPIASSPAPMRKPEGTTAVRSENCSSPCVEIHKKRKSSYDNQTQSHSKLLLSRSAPASTRLLGNFEESVLKGRLPVFGTVEGFTAEIGASGSFCPQHITLPVKCQFFRTSDDNAPSPYMGHIAFKKSKGKRGYHVPRKGTIQLTLFNPHKTVVKVFVVIYNFHDMPSNSHTFLRQKIVSVRNNSANEEEPQNLHYLVHLRFASTRHDHVYLHTDIRLIFPQQTPEISSSKLKVLTYGPVEPKYTLRDR